MYYRLYIAVLRLFLQNLRGLYNYGRPVKPEKFFYLPLQSSISIKTSCIPGPIGTIADSNNLIVFLCPDNIFCKK